MQRNIVFLIKLFFFSVVLALFGFYLFHQSEAYLNGPDISIEYPKDGQITENSFVVIKGRVLNSSALLINGNPVLTDKDGNFNSGLLLAAGYNIIGITAKDKFGRIQDKILEIVSR